MKYMMLMWTAVDATGGSQADFDAWAVFETAAREAGIYVDSGAFQAPADAQLVETSLSGHTIDDAAKPGTYSDTDEQVAAYYLLECVDMAEAVSWAHRLPTYGCVEVRELVEYDQFA